MPAHAVGRRRAERVVHAAQPRARRKGRLAGVVERARTGEGPRLPAVAQEAQRGRAGALQRKPSTTAPRKTGRGRRVAHHDVEARVSAPASIGEPQLEGPSRSRARRALPLAKRGAAPPALPSRPRARRRDASASRRPAAVWLGDDARAPDMSAEYNDRGRATRVRRAPRARLERRARRSSSTVPSAPSSSAAGARPGFRSGRPRAARAPRSSRHDPPRLRRGGRGGAHGEHVPHAAPHARARGPRSSGPAS